MNAKILRRVVALALLAGSAAAQQQAAPSVPQPKIYALSPSGGKAGTVVDVRITSGTDLDGAQKLLFSHPGITAKPLMEEAGRCDRQSDDRPAQPHRSPARRGARSSLPSFRGRVRLPENEVCRRTFRLRAVSCRMR